jgi:hypothetical protein
MDQQNSIDALLIAHRKLGRLQGTEIHPAARQISLSGKGQEDVDRMSFTRFSATCTG